MTVHFLIKDRSLFITIQRFSIINNIEFDHADIYKDLKEIIFQFHQLIRLVPSNGKIIYNGNDKNTADLIDFGHWCNTESYGSHSNSEWKGFWKEIILRFTIMILITIVQIGY